MSATFHYNGPGTMVQHRCDGPSSCQNSVISALLIESVNVDCAHSSACDGTDIYTPLHAGALSMIHIADPINFINIYSLNGLANVTVVCDTGQWIDDRTVSAVNILYGMGYTHLCVLGGDCMQSDIVRSQSLIDDTSYGIIIADLEDLNDVRISEKQIMLFLIRSKIVSDNRLNRKLPAMIRSNESVSSVHVVCVDTAYHRSCDDIHFDFTSAQSASLTASNARDISYVYSLFVLPSSLCFYCIIAFTSCLELDGPSLYFGRISWRSNNMNCLYNLQQTAHLEIGCSASPKDASCLRNRFAVFHCSLTRYPLIICIVIVRFASVMTRSSEYHVEKTSARSSRQIFNAHPNSNYTPN